ncbi:Hypothetical protein NTJ_04706 [Nesidiocoris tenuis]|uniref:Uncharacterized protein n=1 Tax=Nesidiocoris tenuis TaxID=355587 RepID=A0ABN7AIW6_9HEMI|nr:Hypothetical protein NTJ_04706 [Nesidiocoris tenuis]
MPLPSRCSECPSLAGNLQLLVDIKSVVENSGFLQIWFVSGLAGSGDRYSRRSIFRKWVPFSSESRRHGELGRAPEELESK